MRQTVEFAAEMASCDGSINLRGSDVGMAEQFADGLDRHPLRQRDGRCESVTGGVEGDVTSDVRPTDDPPQTSVAPAVARQIENPLAARRRSIT